MARRFRRWPGWGACLLAALGVWVVVRMWWFDQHSAQTAVVSSVAGSRISLQPGPCEIYQVIDGYTLLVAQKSHPLQIEPHCFRVRLLGVGLPAEPFEQQVACAELVRMAPAGPAHVELDKRRAATDGTWLAYVARGDELVNAELLRTGAALHEVYPGDSMPIGQVLKQAQAEARAQRRGLWSDP